MVKLDLRIMGFITTFENITRSKVKDAFFDKSNILVFIVKQGEIGKAIGKKGVNVKKISDVLKKRIKVIEFNSSIEKFIKNCLLPLKVDVIAEDNKITIKCNTNQERGIVIGRDKSNLNDLKDLVGKFFKDVEILVE